MTDAMPFWKWKHEQTKKDGFQHEDAYWYHTAYGRYCAKQRAVPFGSLPHDGTPECRCNECAIVRLDAAGVEPPSHVAPGYFEAIVDAKKRRSDEILAAAVRWRDALQKAGMVRPCDLPLITEIEIITDK